MFNKKTVTSWSILIALMLVWGSSFILIKKSLLYFSAADVGLLRIVITFLFMLPIAIIKLKTLTPKLRNYIILSGLIGSFIPAFLFAIAQTQINSFLAGTLNSLTPLFTLILGLAFFKLKVTWYNTIGVFIGLIGAIGLIYSSSGEQGFAVNMLYSSFIIFASICYAFNVNFLKIYLKELDSLTITSLTFFFIGIPSIVYAAFFSNIPSTIVNTKGILLGLGYISTLSILGTGIALIAFNKLIKMSSPIFASSVTYIIPIVAIAWGIIDGEKFKIVYIFWFILILLGVLLVNTSSKSGAIKVFLKLKKKYF